MSDKLRAWEMPTCVFNNNYSRHGNVKERDEKFPWHVWVDGVEMGEFASWVDAMACATGELKIVRLSA